MRAPVSIRNRHGYLRRWGLDLLVCLTAFGVGFLLIPKLLQCDDAPTTKVSSQRQRDIPNRVAATATASASVSNTPRNRVPGIRIRQRQSIYDVNTLLQRMTLEQKVGQMLMVGFKGPDHKGAIGFVRNYHVGGLVISRSNAITKTQLAVLTESLQQISRSDSGIDLLLATDQEGGSVAHIGKSICPPFASNATSGEENDEIGVIKQAGTTARVFHEVGLNMNFAPVLDVKTNTRNRVIGSRSYGSDPEKVAQLGCAYITELQRCGIIATAKHFPGHGPTSVDSHKDTPIASLTQEQMNIHVHPFKRAIRAGVDAIMTAHIIYTGYDNRPATLSNFWLNGYLRRDLGYQGVIITDSLGMGAIRKNYSWHNVVKDALDAGIDIFLICEGDDLKSLTRQYLLSSVRSGEVPESRIDESVVRILQLKQKYGLIKGGAAAQ